MEFKSEGESTIHAISNVVARLEEYFTSLQRTRTGVFSRKKDLQARTESFAKIKAAITEAPTESQSIEAIQKKSLEIIEAEINKYKPKILDPANPTIQSLPGVKSLIEATTSNRYYDLLVSLKNLVTNKEAFSQFNEQAQKQSASISELENLPDELLLKIVKLLEKEDLNRLKVTSKRMMEIVKDPLKYYIKMSIPPSITKSQNFKKVADYVVKEINKKKSTIIVHEKEPPLTQEERTISMYQQETPYTITIKLPYDAVTPIKPLLGNDKTFHVTEKTSVKVSDIHQISNLSNRFLNPDETKKSASPESKAKK